MYFVAQIYRMNGAKLDSNKSKAKSHSACAQCFLRFFTLNINHSSQTKKFSEQSSFIAIEYDKSPFGQMENFPFAIPFIDAKSHTSFQWFELQL